MARAEKCPFKPAFRQVAMSQTLLWENSYSPTRAEFTNLYGSKSAGTAEGAEEVEADACSRKLTLLLKFASRKDATTCR
jgi:hypothetical protein